MQLQLWQRQLHISPGQLTRKWLFDSLKASDGLRNVGTLNEKRRQHAECHKLVQ